MRQAMLDAPYLWIFLTVTAVLDTMGLFYLWRRRNSSMASPNSLPLTTLPRPRQSRPERRARDRRRTDRAASA